MSRESFLKRGEVKGRSLSHFRARKQEKEIAAHMAKRIWGTTSRPNPKRLMVPGSGAGATKGDVRAPNLVRIECKTTKNKSFSVTLEMIEKIETAAINSGEVPIIVVEFNDGRGRKIKDVAVMPTYMMDRIV